MGKLPGDNNWKLQEAKGNLCVQNQHCAKVHFCSTSNCNSPTASKFSKFWYSKSFFSVKNQWNLSDFFWRMLELETNFYWWNFNLFFHFVKIFYFLKICQKLQKAKGNLCVQNQHCAKVHFRSTSHPPEVWGEYVSSKTQYIYNNVVTRIYASFI